MARYDHLRLIRLPEQVERRKRPGFGAAPDRDRPAHSRRIAAELNDAITAQQRRRPPEAGMARSIWSGPRSPTTPV